MKKKSAYQRQAEKKRFLGSITKPLETKSSFKNSAIETGKDIVAGAVGGGLAGSLLGKASLAVGSLVTGFGHWTKNRWLISLGVGMMASGSFQKSSDSNAKQTMTEGAKQRAVSFKESLKERLFLDKLLKSKKGSSTDDSTNGVGAVNYYTSPNSKELDMKSLDRIESQIANSANQYALVNGMTGLDPDDKNY